MLLSPAPIRPARASRRSARCRPCSRRTRSRPACRTEGDPILLDISASYTDERPDRPRCTRPARSCRTRGCRTRRATRPNDPAVLFNEPKGTLLPLGGLEAGHKGYALALLIEALTGGLAGFGRADPSEGWGATVFVQVLDPQAFGGRDAFVRQTGLACDGLPRGDAAPGGPARAAARRARARADAQAARAGRRPAPVDPAGARAVGADATAWRCRPRAAAENRLMRVMAGASRAGHPASMDETLQRPDNRHPQRARPARGIRASRASWRRSARWRASTAATCTTRPKGCARRAGADGLRDAAPGPLRVRRRQAHLRQLQGALLQRRERAKRCGR